MKRHFSFIVEKSWSRKELKLVGRCLVKMLFPLLGNFNFLGNCVSPRKKFIMSFIAGNNFEKSMTTALFELISLKFFFCRITCKEK